MTKVAVTEPIPIFAVAGRYLIYDVDTVSHIRSAHNICGVLIGNIPQATQQTIFNGIPLQLMPEEARLLVRKGHAFVVDDVVAHETKGRELDKEQKEEYESRMRTDGLEIAEAQKQAAADKKRPFWKKSGKGAELEAEFFKEELEPMGLTPATSYAISGGLQRASMEAKVIPEATPSYPIFAYLHDKGYFMSPGLRFGCQYVAYPGDPLRFHSHFLVTGHECEEEIDLLDIVAGGRLGTGVKKGYMIGGAQPGTTGSEEQVRAFSFEWAAM